MLRVVTAAPGIEAPEASRTDPAMAPWVVDCAIEIVGLAVMARVHRARQRMPSRKRCKFIVALQMVNKSGGEAALHKDRMDSAERAGLKKGDLPHETHCNQQRRPRCRKQKDFPN